MTKRLLVLVFVVLVLLVGAGAVLAKGAANGVFVRFYQGASYCEGYFHTTGSGIVHEWRRNEECTPYAPAINESSLHLVFKPVDKFEYEGCDDKDCIFCVPYEWSISPPYVELDDDDADLRDFLGEDGEQYYWVCMYLWD